MSLSTLLTTPASAPATAPAPAVAAAPGGIAPANLPPAVSTVPQGYGAGQAPAFAPPAATFADPFSGIGSAQPVDRSPTMPAGVTAIVEILRCEAISAPNMGPGYVVHYKVLSASDPAQVGQEYAWKNWAKNAQPFKTACKSLVKAVFNLTNSTADEAMLTAEAEAMIKRSFAEEQVFRGRHVRVSTVAIKTKAGNDFCRHDWSGAGQG